jgi:hypothetical protein
MRRSEADGPVLPHGRRHQLPDSLKDNLELAIVPPLEGRHLLGQFIVRYQHPS